jgi:CRP/FNR family transcriptional regulator, dissimilatory nitrate respiration regulator
MSRMPRLAAALRSAAVERRLAAGEALFHRGDTSAGFFEIVSGRLRLDRTGADGRALTLHAAGAGESIAEASLFSPAYHCDAVAVTDTVVRLYRKSTVLAAFERDPAAAADFMAMLAHQVMTLRTRLEGRNIRSARDRLLHHLMVNAADGRTVILRGTLKELAAELGLSHEALYRALAALEADGEIVREQGCIRLAAPLPE